MRVQKGQVRRKSRAVDSERVRAVAATKRLVPPPTLQNMPAGRLTTVQPSQHGRLDIDPRYQRGQTPMINELMNVLSRGGVIADPVSIAERKWGPELERKKLWIVDGYQRCCAYQALSLPIPAMVYETHSLEQERILFATLNTRYAVSANLTVKAWGGPGAQLIREANEDTDHPLYGRIEMHSSGSHSKIGASMLAGGCRISVTGKTSGKEVRRVLADLDALVGRPAQMKMAKDYLTLIGQVFPEPPPPRNLSVTSLAVALFEHGGKLPDEKIIKLLQKIRWDTLTDSGAVKYRPMVMEAIRRVWL